MSKMEVEQVDDDVTLIRERVVGADCGRGDVERPETMSSPGCEQQPTANSCVPVQVETNDRLDTKSDLTGREIGGISVSPEKIDKAVEAVLKRPDCPADSQVDTAIGLSAEEEADVEKLIALLESDAGEEEKVDEKKSHTATCIDVDCSDNDEPQQEVDVEGNMDYDRNTDGVDEGCEDFKGDIKYEEDVSTGPSRRAKKRKNNNRILPDTPMNDPDSPFYIDRSLVPIFMYREGLRDKRWNPTQVLYEICSQCEWTAPEFTELDYTSSGFLFSVTVQNKTFTPRKRGWTKKQAKHYASSDCLNFIGFRFRFEDIKTNSWSTLKGSSTASSYYWKNKAKVKKEKIETVVKMESQDSLYMSSPLREHPRALVEQGYKGYFDEKPIKREFKRDRYTYDEIYPRPRRRSCSSESSSDPGRYVYGSYYDPLCPIHHHRHRPSSRSSSPDWY